MGYDRQKAVQYARRWAFGRNARYLDFSGLGGDCANFVSQCLYAGGGEMNPTPVDGWYYRSAGDRSASWTSARRLYAFLTSNRGAGPYGQEVEDDLADVGDVVFMGYRNGILTHSALVVAVEGGRLYLAAHSGDAWMRPMDTYSQPVKRLVKILGVRPFVSEL